MKIRNIFSVMAGVVAFTGASILSGCGSTDKRTIDTLTGISINSFQEGGLDKGDIKEIETQIELNMGEVFRIKGPSKRSDRENVSQSQLWMNQENLSKIGKQINSNIENLIALAQKSLETGEQIILLTKDAEKKILNFDLDEDDKNKTLGRFKEYFSDKFWINLSSLTAFEQIIICFSVLGSIIVFMKLLFLRKKVNLKLMNLLGELDGIKASMLGQVRWLKEEIEKLEIQGVLRSFSRELFKVSTDIFKDLENKKAKLANLLDYVDDIDGIARMRPEKLSENDIKEIETLVNDAFLELRGTQFIV